MKKGTKVLMYVDGNSLEGITIENESGVVGSDKRVIRVRWSDKTESIESVSDLIVLVQPTAK